MRIAGCGLRIGKTTYGKGVFVTGTDTGVGKTYVACGIATVLRSRGIDVGVMKPAETGCLKRGKTLVPEDATRLMAAADSSDPLDLVNPYRFREPLAPAVAAERAGTSIRMVIIQKAFNQLETMHDYLIVEGAGGIMVPLTQDALFIDLAAMLKLPVLVVSRPGLGTINHTLLTVEALRSRKIPIAGIVINAASPGRTGAAERTSPAVIEERSGVPVLGIVGHRGRSFDGIAAALQNKTPSFR